MNNYTESFDELLNAAEKNYPYKKLKKMLSEDKMKICFDNPVFRGDFISLCIAKEYAVGINAANELFPCDEDTDTHESIAEFIPLLSGRNRETALLSCIELTDVYCGLTVYSVNNLGYNTTAYMFVVCECFEALDKFLDIYRLLPLRKNALSEYIRIAAKRKKTEYARLFTEKGFTVSDEDIEYLSQIDSAYTGELLGSGYITADAAEETPAPEKPVQKIKNWSAAAEIDRVYISGNVFDSLRGIADGSFHRAEVSDCVKINDEEFIIYEKDKKYPYILRFDEYLNEDSLNRDNTNIQSILDYFGNRIVRIDELTELLLREGDQLTFRGVGYTEKTICKGVREKGKIYYNYIYDDQNKQITRTVLNESPRILPGFRMCGRDFYACFDKASEIIKLISDPDTAFCEYSEKIKELFSMQIGRNEKRGLLELIYCTLRYKASAENFSEGLKLLKEYGLNCQPWSLFQSVNFIYDMTGAKDPAVKAEAFKRLSFHPEVSVFAIIPFITENIFFALRELVWSYKLERVFSKIECLLAENRNFDGLIILCRKRFFPVNEYDLLELTLRSPCSVYDFLYNNFPKLIPQKLMIGSRVMSPEEMVGRLTCSGIVPTGYYHLVSYAYIFFDKRDFEFIINHIPKITDVDANVLHEIFTCVINYFESAYDGKKEMAYYFDKLFADNVKVNGKILAVTSDYRCKLKSHRFFVNISEANDIFVRLPKNFVPICDEEQLLHEIILSENPHYIVAAARHDILNKSNMDKVVQYAVENRSYGMLKTIYRIFGKK